MSQMGSDRRLEAVGRGMLLAWWAGQQPDRPAIVSPRGTRTFAELNDKANRLARALRRRGVRPRSALALISGNLPEFSEVYFAVQRSGISPSLSTFTEEKFAVMS